jgi:hypothetical protein
MGANAIPAIISLFLSRLVSKYMLWYHSGIAWLKAPELSFFNSWQNWTKTLFLFASPT